MRLIRAAFRYQGCAEARLDDALVNVAALDLELVRGDEIVLLWSPHGLGVGLPGERECSGLDGSGPGLEMFFAQRAKHLRHGGIVIRPRCRIRGLSRQLLPSRFRRSHLVFKTACATSLRFRNLDDGGTTGQPQWETEQQEEGGEFTVHGESGGDVWVASWRRSLPLIEMGLQRCRIEAALVALQLQ